ncbi:MAG: binding-protein-dependent transport system inner rane component [Chloroflexi bacterium]|nr:binding-protein-dependent transport system inner rane component [Chloroflexota bacterium]
MILRYAVGRVAQMVPTALIVSFLVFSLIHLIPGDPVKVMLGYSGDDASGAGYSREVYLAMRERMGLDDPLYVQYARWLGRALQGDLGTSLVTGQPVLEAILTRFPATLLLAAIAFCVAGAIAIPMGILAAVRHNTIVDFVVTGVSILGICVPNFWLALLLVLFFSLHLGWLPSLGYVSPTENLGEFLRRAAMPTVVLAAASAARVVRFLRSDVLEQLHQDYVRTARAKGIPRRRILWRHVLKNSLITTATVMAFEVVHLLGGSTVVEVVFSWPGVANLLLQAIYARDFPVVQGVVLLLALTVMFANFAVDIVYRECSRGRGN